MLAKTKARLQSEGFSDSEIEALDLVSQAVGFKSSLVWLEAYQNNSKRKQGIMRDAIKHLADGLEASEEAGNKVIAKLFNL